MKKNLLLLMLALLPAAFMYGQERTVSGQCWIQRGVPVRLSLKRLTKWNDYKFRR